jgi:transposase
VSYATASIKSSHCEGLAPEPVVVAPVSPWELESVTLTKREHIELINQRNYWKSSHQRAIGRLQWAEQRRLIELGRAAQELAALRAQMLQAEERHREALERAGQVELALRSELEVTNARIRDLRKRHFARKSERSRAVNEAAAVDGAATYRARGQQSGAPGHGRTCQDHLPTVVQTIELEASCPQCGLGLKPFPGTQDCEVLEIEVKAYRRIIRRQRYKPCCECGCLPGIVTAPAPARLIAHGKLGDSVWVNILVSKFLYAQPTHRLLRDWRDQGLHVSQGTLTNGLKRLAPLFAPLVQAGLEHLRQQPHWHADETRWAVFIDYENKVGHRWYLWAFCCASVVHFELDPSRSAKVPARVLQGVEQGILSVDRYSAYKSLAKKHPGILLAFCWAHARRDQLELSVAHPALKDWALTWVAQIGKLYGLHEQRRLAYQAGGQDCADAAHLEFCRFDLAVREEVTVMRARLENTLAQSDLAEPARKVLRSMREHWDGLMLFVERPWLDMDNNFAERTVRGPVLGRKNFYGSGSQWSGNLAASMMSLMMTVQLWGINVRTWLMAYLQACAQAGGQSPANIDAFVPWRMDAQRLETMRQGARVRARCKFNDSS